MMPPAVHHFRRPSFDLPARSGDLRRARLTTGSCVPTFARPNFHFSRNVALWSLIIAGVNIGTIGCDSPKNLTPFDDAKSVAAAPQSVAEAPSNPARSTLASTIERLNEQAATLEDNKDVKCWTSFKLLETFIAGCQLTPETTHFKTEVVLNYLDQIWAQADRLADRPLIDGDTFSQIARQAVPWESDLLLEYRVNLVDRVMRVRYQDVENYRSTVEPTRLLQSLASRLYETEPQRKGLSPDAIQAASQLAALLSTIVLVEANEVAKKHQHQQIIAADMLLADRRIARGLSFRPLDRTRTQSPSAEIAEESANADSTMLSIIRQKIHSLKTFNTTYSRDNLGETFVSDLTKHEQQWAKLPVNAEAAAVYKESDLVDLAEFLYEACVRQNPGSNPLTGQQMLLTIQTYYPFVTHFEHGTVHLYPDQPSIRDLKVEEYEADAFRDSAWHWRAMEQAIERTADRHLPSLDLYALEELSEFLSVFSVAYVKLAGQIARDHTDGGVQVIDRQAFLTARRVFVRASESYFKAFQETAVSDDVPNVTDVTGAAGKSGDSATQMERAVGGRAEARQNLSSVYIEDLFTDVTSGTGIDFRHESSPLVERHRFATEGERPQDIAGYVTRAKYLREQGYHSRIPNHSLGIEGGGVAVADVDGDGLLDIYLVSGHGDRLFRNLGDLRFEHVTEPANLGGAAEGRGAYFVDYDNDGDQDLFLTLVYAPNQLFQNQGDCRFIDVTQSAGLPLRADLISHSATWFDFDNDGFLDVYIGNYGNWLGDELPLVQADSRNGQPNMLFRNNGQGGFEDVTSAAGAGDVGWAQAVSHFDMNRDGWQDVYVANDFGQDVILVNDGGRRFTSQVVGEGRYLHGMSVGFTDVNHDGAEDVYVSNIAMFSFASKHIKPDADTRIAVSQRTTLGMRMLENNLFLVSGENGYREQHHAYFDRSLEGSGWAWDADFFDFDNDGEEDLYILNGREPNLSYAYERNVLYKQVAGHFYDVSARSGADVRSNARGAVHADLDADGDLDVVINSYHDQAVVLRNNLQRHHWIRFRLRGTMSNRDAIGARVTIHTPDRKQQLRTVRGGSGFLSKEDNALHFGLRDFRSVNKIDVIWPSGQQQSITDLPANQVHTIVEPR